MRRFVVLSLTVLGVAGLSVATEQRAMGFTGYVDPGSGLLAIQCIASAGATAAYFMRRKIAALFKTKKNEVQILEHTDAVADTSLNDV